MKFIEIQEKEYEEFFKWILEKEEITLTKELDLLLVSSYNNPYIYYTKEIEEFFNTEPMRRLGKINQLGTSINLNENAYHTRLQHCKGAYKNALDFWVLKCKDTKYREKIDKSKDKNNRKNLILADIMEMARHDDGHTMISHALEGLLCNGKASHEDIGKRILFENKQYEYALNNIRNGLYQTMCQNAMCDKSAFKLLREGNVDFDRMDYIMRDLVYLGLPYSRELIENLLRNCNIKEVEIDQEKQEVPVYTLECLQYIESFLEMRKVGYEIEYASQDIKVLDTAVKYLCKIVNSRDDMKSSFISLAISNYMQDNILDIDLEKYIQENDIKMYTEILNIALHNQDDNLRELAILCLPSTTGLIQLGVEMLDTKQRGKDLEKYEEYELEYIKLLKELRSPKNSNIQDRIENSNKRKLFIATNVDNETQLEEMKNKLKLILCTDSLPMGIITWNRKMRIYKEDEPLYIENDDGKIYTLNTHPKRNIDISNQNIMGIAIIPSVMKLLGYDDSVIREAQNIVNGNNTKDSKKEVVIHAKRMSEFQVGKCPYLIGFEEK